MCEFEGQYEKFWKTKLVHREPVVFQEIEPGVYRAKLFYKPIKIYKIENFNCNKEYSLDEVCCSEEGYLYLTKSSKIPFLSISNLNHSQLPSNTELYKTGKEDIIYTESDGLVIYQTYFTYLHEDKWDGKEPLNTPELLPHFLHKLHNKEDVNVVLNGDSISVGCNSSKYLNVEPFQDTYIEGFTKEIKRKYGSNLKVVNTSKGGTVSKRGCEDIEENILNHNPDLVIIAYGMNDGSCHVKKEEYVEHIVYMIDKIRKHNCDTEILLIASIIPNKNTAFFGEHLTYLNELERIVKENKGIALLDMTSYSVTLANKKDSFELYANNINHPCDFLVRAYITCLMNLIEE